MVTCCLTDFTTSFAYMTGRRFISEEFLPELADNLSWWAVKREVNIRLYGVWEWGAGKGWVSRVDAGRINCDVKRQTVIPQSLYAFKLDVNWLLYLQYEHLN